MTTHEVAKQLLAMPDVPVAINGYADRLYTLTRVQALKNFELGRDINESKFAFDDDTVAAALVY